MVPPRQPSKNAGVLRSASDVLVESLDDGGDALADADAHGRQTIAAAALLHLVNERRHDSCATATQRMTERDGAAVDVQFLEIDTEFTCARQYLRGEGFVQLNEINLIDG